MTIILKQMKGALCAVALLLTSTVAMGIEVKDLFMNEPGVVFELLPEATRISMVSYYENEQDVYATNRAGNSSHIIDLKPRHMSIEMSAGRKVELALLIQGKDSAIMVIEHFSIPYPDAVVTFYDTRWKPLKTDKLFKAPTLESFIKPGTPAQVVRDITQNVSFPLIDYELNADNLSSMTARQHLADFYTATDYARWKPYLYETLNYAITGKKITLTPLKK